MVSIMSWYVPTPEIEGKVQIDQAPTGGADSKDHGSQRSSRIGIWLGVPRRNI